MGNSIQEESGIPCVCNDFTGEVLRGIRMHATRFMKDLEESDMNKVSLTLTCLCVAPYSECIIRCLGNVLTGLTMLSQHLISVGMIGLLYAPVNQHQYRVWGIVQTLHPRSLNPTLLSISANGTDVVSESTGSETVMPYFKGCSLQYDLYAQIKGV